MGWDCDWGLSGGCVGISHMMMPRAKAIMRISSFIGIGIYGLFEPPGGCHTARGTESLFGVIFGSRLS